MIEEMIIRELKKLKDRVNDLETHPHKHPINVINDVQMPLSGFGKGAAAPATVYLGNYMGFEFTTNDEVYYSFEVPYDWDSAEDIAIEIHWYIDEVALVTKEVRWNVMYTCTKEDSSEAVDHATATLDSGDIAIPALAKRLVQTELVIPAAALQADDVVGIIIKRVAIVDGTAPTAKPTMVGALLEYVADKLGEAV